MDPLPELAGLRYRPRAHRGGALAAPGGPSIHIRLVSVMGGSSVRRGRKLTKAERRELREAKRREIES